MGQPSPKPTQPLTYDYVDTGSIARPPVSVDMDGYIDKARTVEDNNPFLQTAATLQAKQGAGAATAMMENEIYEELEEHQAPASETCMYENIH